MLKVSTKQHYKSHGAEIGQQLSESTNESNPLPCLCCHLLAWLSVITGSATWAVGTEHWHFLPLPPEDHARREGLIHLPIGALNPPRLLRHSEHTDQFPLLPKHITVRQPRNSAAGKITVLHKEPEHISEKSPCENHSQDGRISGNKSHYRPEEEGLSASLTTPCYGQDAAAQSTQSYCASCIWMFHLFLIYRKAFRTDRFFTVFLWREGATQK